MVIFSVNLQDLFEVVGIDFIAGNVAKHPKIPVVFY
jgi:hypothetical protein